MTNTELMEHWVESSDSDYDVMMTLYKGEKYAWCLFLGHLVLEKLIKAIHAKNNPTAPYAAKKHDLLYLADKSGLALDDDKRAKLDLITTFNMNARYEDYKKDFSKKCTKEYTDKQLTTIEEIRTWLKAQLM